MIPIAEVLVMSGARAGRYIIEADSEAGAIAAVLADAKSRKLRNPYVLQILFPLGRPAELNPSPEFTRSRVRRDGR